MKKITQKEFDALSDSEKKAYWIGLYNKDPERAYMIAEDNGEDWPDFDTYALYHGNYEQFLKDQDYISNFDKEQYIPSVEDTFGSK